MQTWCSENITGFCHVEAALAWDSDFLGITELRGSPEEAAGAGKQFGEAVACSEPDGEGTSLVGIYFCGTKGKSVNVPCGEGWGHRIAAVQVKLSKSLICTVVCLCGHTNPTKELLEDLNQRSLSIMRPLERGR